MRSRINNIDLAYDISGPTDAQAVVLHHPLAASMSFWDEAAEALNRRFRVIRFDARGHGESEAPLGPYRFDSLARDVVSLMDHLGVARAHFVGLSMGGMVAQFLGLSDADRLASLTIVSATSRMPEAARPIWRDRIAAVRAGGMKTQVEPSLPRWLTTQTRANEPELVARCAATILSTPVEGYAGWCAAIETLDVTDQLGAIEVPTHVIVGAEDPGTPVAASFGDDPQAHPRLAAHRDTQRVTFSCT
jgi:3-oxoadipate enol-lactonase